MALEGFTLTSAVDKLIEEGKIDEAAEVHNATVERAFEKAKAGAIINLSDLMASHSTIEMSRVNKRRKQKSGAS